ncbi:unnamed protein product [Cuscuta campestris]|uniref:Retrovirus-related Pol polyprotein from transposon TNT 1-94-like beta-barrel domain-containing protein n=1 Tax=Cuscuta campestris TaxID=132261 RepID=A0A484KUJ2_9ASTE|nr:unnamed protein product [Cuscuta campestris]
MVFSPIWGFHVNRVDEKAWTTLNRKAIASIGQYVSLSVLQHVANETNAFEMWKKLESMYERNNAMGKASLIRKLVKSQYKDGDSIVVHMNEFQGVMVKASLLNEEARRKESGYPSQAEANVIPESSRGRSKSRNPHYRNKSRGRSKSRKRDFICHYCQKPGHIERFCRKKKRDMSRERKDKNESSEQKPEEKNTTALASNDDDLFVIGDHGLLNVACDDCTWVIDFGASYHITSHREYFSSYTSGDFGHVRMGNDGSSKIIGMGDVCLETSTGCRLVLRDVRHIPDIRLSLISAGLLDDEGYANKFCDGRWKLSRGSLIMARETNEHVDMNHDSHTNEDETISNEVEHDSVESHVENDLHDYQLARDRNRRTISKPARYVDDRNMSEFAFHVFKFLECDEPKTYRYDESRGSLSNYVHYFGPKVEIVNLFGLAQTY